MRRTHLLAAGLTSSVIALLTLGTPALAGGWTYDGTNHPSVGKIFGQQTDPSTCSVGVVSSCSAVVVSPTVAITSATCAWGWAEAPFPITAIWLNINPDNPYDCSTALRVASFQWHPRWNPSSSWKNASPYDIGVLILEDPFPLAPASLPPAESQGDYVKGDPFDYVTWYPLAEGDPIYDDRRAVAQGEFLSSDNDFLRLKMSVDDEDYHSYEDGSGVFLPFSQDLSAMGIGWEGPDGCSHITVLRLDTPTVRDFLAGFVTLP